MSLHNLKAESYCFGGNTVSVLVPDNTEVLNWYKASQQAGATVDPYGTRIWPAAIALCQYLSQNLELIRGKSVLELAAGLGLPSLWCAAFAREVCCSDYSPEAVAIAEKSKHLNSIQNLECCQLDWNDLPPTLKPDIVLLSDINYEPSSFDLLFGVIKSFLSDGVTVVLSTPQRLSSKPFIDQIIPWNRNQQEMSILYQGTSVYITVLVLQAKV